MSETTRRLPLGMTTVFQDLLLLTYSVSPDRLAELLPPCIHPYLREGRGFVSIVVANIRGMRPKPLPEFLGTNYYQVVYRAVVRLEDAEGQGRPGVFFLRSDGNDSMMSFFGNRLTEFRFHYFNTGAVAWFEREAELLVTVETVDGQGDLVAHLRREGPADQFPPAEGFASVEEEKETLIQLFHAFAYDEQHDQVFDLEIERGEWHMERLRLLDRFSAFFEETPFRCCDARPLSHVYIRDCRYVWKPMVALPAADLHRRRT
ncbi:MAG TPA: DUF2071 domain-containing protein [Armatimonadota bacterium]|nr:DUF2071 domain-containing protein [Armatimonadota bacterium]